MRRSIAVILPVALPLSAAGVAAALVFTRAGDAPSLRGSTPPAGIVLPAFTLPDHEGHVVQSADLAGRAVLITFLDTQCTESCPIIASVIGQALRMLTPEERRGVAAVAISTDPAEDTAESVDLFLRRNRVADGQLRYLVAPVSDLRPVWDAYRILPSLDSGDDSLHSAPVRPYDRDGVWVATLHAGADLTATNLVHDVRALLRRG